MKGFMEKKMIKQKGGTQLDSSAEHYNEPLLKVFRVHPNGIRIEKADKTLDGQANKGALTWCGPFTYANSLGWWVWPPIDIDIACYPQGTPNCWEGRWGGHFRFNVLEDYDDQDKEVMKGFDPKSGLEQIDHEDPSYGYLGKQHYSIDEPEKDCFSIWTGCFFQMPQDWGLLIRSPINRGIVYQEGSPASIQEGVLEVDWMRYDIWMNFKFTRYEEKVSFRRNQKEPVAQLIPIHKSAYEMNWDTQIKIMDPNDEDCLEAFKRYNEYNFRKWKEHGEKDSMAYRKLRKSEMTKCPFGHMGLKDESK